MTWRSERPEPLQADSLFDLDAGKEARDEGTELAGAGIPAALEAAWRSSADESIVRLAAAGSPFTADDLVADVGEPPIPNMLGGVFLRHSKGGRIRGVGYQPGKRPAAHARVQRVWVGVDAPG